MRLNKYFIFSLGVSSFPRNLYTFLFKFYDSVYKVKGQRCNKGEKFFHPFSLIILTLGATLGGTDTNGETLLGFLQKK